MQVVGGFYWITSMCMRMYLGPSFLTHHSRPAKLLDPHYRKGQVSPREYVQLSSRRLNGYILR